mmetsp:Transcript_2036/g.1836  ORF Transcript_2036/g.1836 Transcript_2036/m.1836 type:complete len:82 (-) Transcript_2036:1350-1595(-)
MKERIQQYLLLENKIEGSQAPSGSHQLGENSHNSTTEGNPPNNQLPYDEDESEAEGGIMDRADVLFKYILRSFRKHYCKSF